MLVVSGELEPTTGGPATPLDTETNHRRTLYATVDRRDMSPTLMIHDFPDANQHSPMRTATVTPLQGLFAINGPLLQEQAQALVARLDQTQLVNNSSRIRQAYLWLFSRAPTVRELELGLAYLTPPPPAGNTQDDAALARWHQYAHVLLASNEFIFID